MSNLAEKIQRQQEVETKVSVKTVTKKAKLSLGEKILWTCFGLFIFSCSVSLISVKASLYKVNSTNVDLQQEVNSLQKTNGELQVEIGSLTTYERIAEIAKRNGLTINSDNVRSLNE